MWAGWTSGVYLVSRRQRSLSDATGFWRQLRFFGVLVVTVRACLLIFLTRTSLPIGFANELSDSYLARPLNLQ